LGTTALNSSRAISRVIVELKTNVSEFSSGSIIGVDIDMEKREISETLG
jgi:hypothetical protein